MSRAISLTLLIFVLIFALNFHSTKTPVINQTQNQPPIASGVVSGLVESYSTSDTKINIVIFSPKGKFLVPLTDKTCIISHNPRIIHDLKSFSSYLENNHQIIGIAGVNPKGITDDLIVRLDD